MTLKTKISEFDAEKIDSWEPCYPASKHIKPGEIHTVITLLDRKDIPFDDRLWVIMRDELVSDKLMRLFAVWCARQVQHLMKDERSIKALDVAEAFANGNATKEELAAAWSVARSAASDAAWYAAWYADRSADRSAARYAARYAAWYAAWCAARYAARYAQENKLREMLIEGIETGDVK